jgi:hypothetical protein
MKEVLCQVHYAASCSQPLDEGARRSFAGFGVPGRVQLLVRFPDRSIPTAIRIAHRLLERRRLQHRLVSCGSTLERQKRHPLFNTHKPRRSFSGLSRPYQKGQYLCRSFLLRHTGSLDVSCRYRSERHSSPSSARASQTIQKQTSGLQRWSRWRGRPMADKTFLIRFKWATYLSPRPVLAARAEVRGEHLILLNSENKLAALFLLEIVDSWSEVKWNA